MNSGEKLVFYLRNFILLHSWSLINEQRFEISKSDIWKWEWMLQARNGSSAKEALLILIQAVCLGTQTIPTKDCHWSPINPTLFFNTQSNFLEFISNYKPRNTCYIANHKQILF